MENCPTKGAGNAKALFQGNDNFLLNCLDIKAKLNVHI